MDTFNQTYKTYLIYFWYFQEYVDKVAISLKPKKHLSCFPYFMSFVFDKMKLKTKQKVAISYFLFFLLFLYFSPQLGKRKKKKAKVSPKQLKKKFSQA